MQTEVDQKYSNYASSAINNFFCYYKQRFGNTKPIFVCIGSPNVPWDSIGPYVGSVLSDIDPTLKVYGTIKKPVNSANVNTFAKRLWVKNFFNRPIIAIDACIGKSAPGTIWCLESSGIKPGEGCGKDLEYIGNTAILVTTTNNPETLETDNTKMMQIAINIAKSIYENLCTL